MITRFEHFCASISSIQNSLVRIQRQQMGKYGLKGPHAQCLLMIAAATQGITAAELPGRIHVVDSKTIALGSAILVEYALELLDRGLMAEEIAWKLLQKREKIRLIALLDTLEYLKKGGRISSTVAFAGGLLNIKPVACIEDGQIKLLGKARGSRQGNNLLVQQIQKSGGVDFSKPVLLGYTGLSDALLHKYIADSAELWKDHRGPLNIRSVGSVVGTHAGPGAVAVAFFSAK